MSMHHGMFVGAIGVLRGRMEAWSLELQAVSLPPGRKHLLRTGLEQSKVELMVAARGRNTTRVQKCAEILKVT